MYFKLIDVSPQEEQEFRNYLIQHSEVPWVVGRREVGLYYRGFPFRF